MILITLPNYISIQSGGICSSSNALLGCSVTSPTLATIIITGSVSKLTSITVTLNSIINPPQALTTSSFNIATYYDTGLDSLVDSLTTGMTFTSTAKQLTSNVFVVPSSYVTYAFSNYIFSIQLTDKIIAGGYISITFPNDITVGTISIVSASFTTTSCTLNVSGNIVKI